MIKTAGSIFVAAALLIGLAGCQSDAGPDDDTGTPSEDLDASPPPDPDDDEDGDDDSQDAADLTPEGCLSNRWLLDNESWRAMLQPMTNEAGGTVESVTGEFVLDLQSDGNYSSTYTGWTVTTVTTDGTAVIERNGTDGGQWTISGDNVELLETSPGSAVEGYVDAGGQRIPLPAVGTADSGSLETFGYLCSADALQITIDMGTVFLTRMP